ncbi:MAG: hypothetical protein L0H38_03335 [bacterium]|nr:hypothetical protein [bacterium]
MDAWHDRARKQRLNAQFHARHSQRLEASARRFLDGTIEAASMEILYQTAVQSIAMMCVSYYDETTLLDTAADFTSISDYLSGDRIVVSRKGKTDNEIVFWIGSRTTVRVYTRTHGHKPEVIVLHKLLRRLNSDRVTDDLPEIVATNENGVEELRFADRN